MSSSMISDQNTHLSNSEDDVRGLRVANRGRLGEEAALLTEFEDL